MDLRQLEIIRAIAETGSFTAAGHKLHVSQSAISRQILLLEDELKEPVFLRVGRRIRITPAGEALLQLSHRVFQDLKDTIAGITDSQESLRGAVRLLGGMTVCLYVFPTLINELKRQHPDVDVIAINRDDAAAARALFDQRGWTKIRLLADDGEVSQRYNVSALPHTVVIDREGIVRHIAVGRSSTVEAAVRAALGRPILK